MGRHLYGSWYTSSFVEATASLALALLKSTRTTESEPGARPVNCCEAALILLLLHFPILHAAIPVSTYMRRAVVGR